MDALYPLLQKYVILNTNFPPAYIIMNIDDEK